jgi:3-methyladenine DNA glycosylase AlkD
MPRTAKGAKDSIPARVDEALTALRRFATAETLTGMTRYGIPNDNALGVAVGDIRTIAKSLGKDHEFALALWIQPIYEARMLACFVDNPAEVTAGQMDAWCKSFDSWALCDTACFHLFDRTPLVWRKIHQWASRKPEFERRAAFALLASVALHDKDAEDGPFLEALPLIRAASTDERNFVKKALVWALRGVAGRNTALKKAALAIAEELATSNDRTARWIGTTARREIAKSKRPRQD